MNKLVKFLFFLVFISYGATLGKNQIINEEVELTDTNNRLSGNVRPTNYKLELRFEEDFYVTNKFAGTVKISLSIAKNKIKYFRLHSKDLEITEMSMHAGAYHIGASYIQDSNSTDFITIYPRISLEKGTNYQLRICYRGNLIENSAFGFYKTPYTDNKKTRYLVATLFETMNARTAFPCFDEPAFKATFDITIKCPRNYIALANTKPVGNPVISHKLKLTTFKTTPPISTYLVAFAVSEFDCEVIDTKISICTRPEVKNTTQLAAKLTPNVLQRMKNYTGVSYNEMGLGKLDLLINPFFPPVGMENWGLVTYAESFSLWDPEESSNNQKQLAVISIAHELSHQWIGNMVTLNWWSDVFLKEGFATYFGYLIPNEIDDYSNWELVQQFVILEMQTVLVTDSLNTSLPLSYDTNDTEVLLTRFDEISYNKGASILRMVDHFLGHKNFKSWLHEYVRKYKFLTTTPRQLWSVYDSIANEPEILPADTTFAEVMQNWTTKSGYPLLTVASDGENVTIIQEQFLLNGTGDFKWHVPITYTLSTDTSGFTKTATKAWLTPHSNLILPGIMKGVDWIILNNQQIGYYRVNYDPILFSKISETLKNNIDMIDEISRSQFIDDQFNLARSGRKNYKNVLNFIIFLKNDTSYYSWYSASKCFELLFRRIADKTVEKALIKYVADLLPAVINSVPLDKVNVDNQIYTLKQVLVQKWACYTGYETCLKASVDILDNLKTRRIQRINPNLRSLVYCYGLKFSENASEDFYFIWQKYLHTQLSTEKDTILEALSCTNNTTLRTWYLANVLSNKIKKSDTTTVINSILSKNNGATEVITFLTDNYNRLRAHFGANSDVLVEAISASSEAIKRQSEIDLLNRFIQIKNIDESLKEAATNGLVTAKKNLEVTDSIEKELKSYFGL